MKHYEFWFIVGSQTLYGEDVLTTVARRAEEMAQKQSAVQPKPLKNKVTAKSSAEITQPVQNVDQRPGYAPEAVAALCDPV